MAGESDGSGADSDDAFETHVADPEAFNQTERLRAINQSRERAGEAFEVTMAQVRTESDFDIADRQQILRAAVMRYLTNIEWLIHKAEEYELLQKVKLGEVRLQPPPKMAQVAQNSSGDYPRVIGSVELEPEVWPIRGIQGFLTAPEQFSASWSLSVDTRHSGPSSLTETRTTFMPAYVSFNAFRKANQFLSNQGVDVDLAEEQNRTVVDDEVLEEVEAWRKKNV